MRRARPLCSFFPLAIITNHGLMLQHRAADFSFGSTVGALDAWAAGRELAMVAKNDELASWMPVVSSLLLFVCLSGR